MAVKRITALIVASCLAAACATLPRLSSPPRHTMVEARGCAASANADAQMRARCMGQQGYGVAALSAEEQAAFKALRSKAEQRAWMAARMTAGRAAA